MGNITIPIESNSFNENTRNLHLGVTFGYAQMLEMFRRDAQSVENFRKMKNVVDSVHKAANALYVLIPGTAGRKLQVSEWKIRTLPPYLEKNVMIIMLEHDTQNGYKITALTSWMLFDNGFINKLRSVETKVSKII